MQTRTESVIEVWVNILSGMAISFLLGLLVYPLYGFQVTPMQNGSIVLIFTGVSMVRSYFWRRLFNRRTEKKYTGR